MTQRLCEFSAIVAVILVQKNCLDHFINKRHASVPQIGVPLT